LRLNDMIIAYPHTDSKFRYHSTIGTASLDYMALTLSDI
jgi:hypothetical protein